MAIPNAAIVNITPAAASAGTDSKIVVVRSAPVAQDRSPFQWCDLLISIGVWLLIRKTQVTLGIEGFEYCTFFRRASRGSRAVVVVDEALVEAGGGGGAGGRTRARAGGRAGARAGGRTGARATCRAGLAIG